MSNQAFETLPLSRFARVVCEKLLSNSPETFTFADTGDEIEICFDSAQVKCLHTKAIGPHYTAYGFKYVLVFDEQHVVWIFVDTTRTHTVGFVKKLSAGIGGKCPLLSDLQVYDKELTLETAPLY